jgi:hypothetical protein
MAIPSFDVWDPFLITVLYLRPCSGLSVNQGSAVSGAQQELGGQTDTHTQSILAQGFAQTQAYGSNAVQQGGAVDLNEDGIIDDYERAYSRGEAQKGQMSSESMGTAAAMSASPTSQCWTLIASLTSPLPFLLYDVVLSRRPSRSSWEATTLKRLRVREVGTCNPS